MKLLYKAVTRDGKIVRGLIEGRDSKEAGTFLRSQGLFPITVTEKSEKGFFQHLPFFGKSHASDVVFFTRQLSSMISSGLTLMQSLRILKDQIHNESMRDVVQGIMNDIEEGRPLSQSLIFHKEVFSPVYVSLIKAAETSGLLDKVLERLAETLEKQHRLKSTIKGALVYPSIIVIGMIAVGVLMMTVVIPPLSTLYKSLNVELPFVTKVVLAISNVFVAFWPFVLGGVVFFAFILGRWRYTDAGRMVTDDFLLRLPLFGRLIQQTILTEILRTFGLLVGSGTSVVEGLNQTADVAGNVLYRNAILGVAERVEKGITIGEAMGSSSLFPAIVVEMVKIGEQTGRLDEQLLRLSDYFEREVDQSVKTLTTVMEPLIIVLLGVGVGFLIIAVITPIYSLISSLQ